ncbi:VOC family protein [Pedobacter sp. MC2016-14]|uniref:VOC family protein n=1 Tax=Pedobacter sp. MC2016-14 TaxID=2897327 RepID=UPI001E5AE5D7|nr:VOC family protein [Pedobacter sp. MC2016-14]MCD0490601.1 VOC family protein [Pedobacter sp. MC2016-14]
MQQRITVLTIGANDLAAMQAFYQDILGWKPVAKNADIVFYQMNGFLLSIAKKERLSEFLGVKLGERGPITIGHNVATEQEVTALYEEFIAKGVTILKEPTTPPFGGLFFYFQDVEGNVLEVACNSFVLLDDVKNVVGHKSINDL